MERDQPLEVFDPNPGPRLENLTSNPAAPTLILPPLALRKLLEERFVSDALADFDVFPSFTEGYDAG